MHPFKLTRARRKSISLRIGKDLSVLVRAPMSMPLAEIERFVAKHAHWIDRHQILQAQENECRNLTDTELNALRCTARALLPERVAHFAAIMGVTPTGVKITSAATRWGSCNAKNSLCFSCRLMRLPAELIDYVVVHELAHIRVKNHSAAFYREVAAYLPDYRARMQRLKHYQREI